MTKNDDVFEWCDLSDLYGLTIGNCCVYACLWNSLFEFRSIYVCIDKLMTVTVVMTCFIQFGLHCRHFITA